MHQNLANDLLYLIRILEGLGKIQAYTSTFLEVEEFFFANEQKEFNASLMLFLQIGEQAGKISEETKRLFPTFEWGALSGLRNRIAHDYIGIDKIIIFEIIKHQLPFKKTQLEVLVREGIESGFFSKEELKASIGSPFYQHVDFSVLK